MADAIIGAIIKRTGKDPDAIEAEHPISREDADLLLAIDAGELDEVWRAGAARLNYDRIERLVELGVITARATESCGTPVLADLRIAEVEPEDVDPWEED